MRRALIALGAVALLLLGTSGQASAAPTSSYSTRFVPSPYPWEAPIEVVVNGYKSLISVGGGPYQGSLGIRVEPPTTSPIYSEQFRLLTYGTHTETRWRNTTTGASGVVHTDQNNRYPSGFQDIQSGYGWVEFTVIVTVGAFVPQINPQSFTATGAVEVNDRVFD